MNTAELRPRANSRWGTVLRIGGLGLLLLGLLYLAWSLPKDEERAGIPGGVWHLALRQALLPTGSVVLLIGLGLQPVDRLRWLMAVIASGSAALIGWTVGTYGFILLGNVVFAGALDQGALLVFITGPVGALVGAAAGVHFALGHSVALVWGTGALVGIVIGGVALLAIPGLGVLLAILAPVAGGWAAPTLLRVLRAEYGSSPPSHDSSPWHGWH
jgi:hypothetical protein